MTTTEQKTGSAGGHEAPGTMALFLETHGIPVSTAKTIGATIGLLMLICLVASVVLWRRTHAAGLDAEATRELFSDRTQSQANMETLMERCSSSKLAPLIMLKQAQIQYSEGNHELAYTTCERFLKTYPQHELARAAELGLVFCKEARSTKDDLEAACKGFADFAAQYQGYFLSNEAIFGRARCLEKLGRLEEARQVYEDFKVAHPTENIWQDRAEAGLKTVEAEQRRRSSTL